MLALPIDTTALAAACLWSFALYLGGESPRERLTVWLERRLGPIERALRRSEPAAPHALGASVLSIVPFLLAGALCNWSIAHTLGARWSVAVSLLACAACGIYELGRQSYRSDA